MMLKFLIAGIVSVVVLFVGSAGMAILKAGKDLEDLE